MKKELTQKDLEFFTVPELARLFRVKKSYIYELIYSGRLQAIKLSERRLRIPASALNEFINSQLGNNSIVQPLEEGVLI